VGSGCTRCHVVERAADDAVSQSAVSPVTLTASARPKTPSLFRVALAHEWRLLRSDRVISVVLVLFAILLTAALINGVTWVRFQRETLSTLRAADATRFSGYADTLRAMAPDAPSAGPFAPDPRNPMTIGSRGGTLAALDPSPLAALAVGQSDLLPYYFRVTTGSRQSVLKGDEIENPGNLLTGRFDLAFVIVVLFPLVILALSYNMLPGEREDGTLALVLSHPVRIQTVLMAKIAVRATVVLAIAAAMVLLGLLATRADGAATTSVSTVAWWLALVAAYATMWFGIALVINAVARGSAVAAVASTSVWLVVVILAPVLLNLMAQSRYPAPSRVAFTNLARSVTNEANAVSDRLMSKYLVDHPELATGGTVDMSDFWTKSLTVQDTIEKTLAPHYAAFERQLAEQQRVLASARVFTPALIMQTALEDLAGTGLPRWQSFRTQTLAFHQQWQGFFVPRQIQQRKLTVADVAAVPTFKFAEPTADATTTAVGRALAWLLLLSACVWGVGLWRVRQLRAVA
jgi:ABC-2 type transport system permease protein